MVTWLCGATGVMDGGAGAVVSRLHSSTDAKVHRTVEELTEEDAQNMVGGGVMVEMWNVLMAK